MAHEIYIVEGANWKCKVTLETNPDNDADYRLIEAATRCMEYLFSDEGRYDETVEIFELKNGQGLDYFAKTKKSSKMEAPDPAFGLLTKIYRPKDVSKTDNHYVIRTRILMENASAYTAIPMISELEADIKKKNPQLYNTVTEIMKNKIVFKFGDVGKDNL